MHLTKREQVAMAAMQGLLSRPCNWDSTECATRAVVYADALIAELDRTEGEH